jgi:hypothetical protein
MRRLWEYLDRELSEADAEDVRQHLADCGRCRPHATFEQRLLDEIAAVRPEHDDLAALRDRMAAALALHSDGYDA